MTYDLLNTFKKYFQDDKVIIDTYELTDGYYYVFNEDGTFEKLKVVKNESDNYELEKYIKIRDFYSKYISSNKALDTTYTEEIDGKKYTMLKKICSNNIYTLFFKNKSVFGLCNKEAIKDAVPVEVFKKGVGKYYDSLMKLGNSPKEKILAKERYTEQEIKENKEKILKAFDLVCEDLKDEDMPKETWIKIFLKKDVEEYKRVANIYIRLKLFNTNDNNIKIDEKTYGANNYNYGLNSKKPYLELKSTPYKVGSFIDDTDIELMNKMYIWLYNSAAGKTILKLPYDWKFHGIPKDDEAIKDKDTYIIKVAGNNGNARIDDYRYTTNYNTRIRPFICKDYLSKEKLIVFETENIYGLNWYTTNIWFAENEKSKRNYIMDSYYDYDLKISKSMLANWKKELLKQYNNLFLELFEEENSKNFVNKLDEIALNIVKNMLIDSLKQKKTYKTNPIRAFNLWIAYKEYFKKEGEEPEMKINNIYEQCERIVKEKGKIETDEQYYFLVGQVAYYLLTRSKASKLTQDVTEPILRANTIDRIKDELKLLREKYGYDVFLVFPKFNNIFSQLMSQNPEGKVKENTNMLLAGLLAENLFYNSKEENGGNENV